MLTGGIHMAEAGQAEAIVWVKAGERACSGTGGLWAEPRAERWVWAQVGHRLEVSGRSL